MPKPTPLSPALQEKILDLAHAYGLTALEIAPRFRVPYAAVNALLGAERARVAELARIKARADAWAAGTWPPDSDSSAAKQRDPEP